MPGEQTQVSRTLFIAATIAMILNAIGIFAALLGGVSWVSSVNTNIQVTTESVKNLAGEVKDLQQWRIAVDQRHAAKDAVTSANGSHREKASVSR